MGNKAGKSSDSQPGTPNNSTNGVTQRRPKSPSTAYTSVADIKVAVRGANGVGKTTLVDRLTGRHFNAAYTPSIETTVRYHNLTFKLADEMTVAIYDVNDDFDENNKSYYEICNVIAFVIDPRSKMSLEFVKAELPKVAKMKGVKDVLLLINFKDLVTKDPGSVSLTIDDLRSLGSFGVKLTTFEVCLKDCYGLKTLQTIMNRPYIHHRMLALKKEMNELSEQLVGTEEEIKMYIASMNYEQYLGWLKTMQVPKGGDPKVGRRDSKVSMGGSGSSSGSGQNDKATPKKKSRASSTFSMFSSSKKKKEATTKNDKKSNLKHQQSSKGQRTESLSSVRSAQNYMLNDDDDDDEGGLSDFLDEENDLGGFYGSDEEDTVKVPKRQQQRQQQQQQEEEIPRSVSPPQSSIQEESGDIPWSDQSIDDEFYLKEDNSLASIKTIRNNNLTKTQESHETKNSRDQSAGSLSDAAKAAIAAAAQAAENAKMTSSIMDNDDDTISSLNDGGGSDDGGSDGSSDSGSKKEKKDKKDKKEKKKKEKKEKKKKDKKEKKKKKKRDKNDDDDFYGDL
jgi:GTPase SAR1 family protein